MMYTRNLLLQSMHSDWYICQSEKKTLHGVTDIVLDFYDGDPDVLGRCTFLFHPIAQNENKYKMCKYVLGPIKHPMISGQPLPHPPHLMPPPTPPPPPAFPSCIPVCPAGTEAGAQEQPPSIGAPEPSVAGPSMCPLSFKTKTMLLYPLKLGLSVLSHTDLTEGLFLCSFPFFP